VPMGSAPTNSIARCACSSSAKIGRSSPSSRATKQQLNSLDNNTALRPRTDNKVDSRCAWRWQEWIIGRHAHLQATTPSNLGLSAQPRPVGTAGRIKHARRWQEWIIGWRAGWWWHKVDSRCARRWQEWIIGRRAHSKVPGALRSRVEVERRPHALDAHLCRTSSSASLSGRISVPFGGMSQPEGAASVWCSPAAS